MSNQKEIANNQERGYYVRNLIQDDFFWLKNIDCAPLHTERDSIYLFFCVHFRSTSFVLIDAISSKPLGFLLGFLPNGSSIAYIHYLFVLAAHRNQGLGRSLVKHFLEASQKLGADEITLYTSKAVAFYQKQGFEACNSIFSGTVLSYLEHKKGVRVMRLAANG
jgi:ribosomal protein S18 acetylase RimI-like enzyme